MDLGPPSFVRSSSTLVKHMNKKTEFQVASSHLEGNLKVQANKSKIALTQRLQQRRESGCEGDVGGASRLEESAEVNTAQIGDEITIVKDDGDGDGDDDDGDR